MSSSTRINPPSHVIFNYINFRENNNEFVIICCIINYIRSKLLPFLSFQQILEVVIFSTEPTSYLLPLMTLVFEPWLYRLASLVERSLVQLILCLSRLCYMYLWKLLSILLISISCMWHSSSTRRWLTRSSREIFSFLCFRVHLNSFQESSSLPIIISSITGLS